MDEKCTSRCRVYNVYLFVHQGPLLAQMYGPAADSKWVRAWKAEVADMYPACLIGTWAVASMGIRTRLWPH
jgi:hypothetical protein